MPVYNFNECAAWMDTQCEGLPATGLTVRMPVGFNSNAFRKQVSSPAALTLFNTTEQRRLKLGNVFNPHLPINAERDDKVSVH